MTMNLQALAAPSFPSDFVLDEKFTALGVASFEVENIGGPTTYGVRAATWDFVIVPEPHASFLVLGGALLLLVARRNPMKQ